MHIFYMVCSSKTRGNAVVCGGFLFLFLNQGRDARKLLSLRFMLTFVVHIALFIGVDFLLCRQMQS